MEIRKADGSHCNITWITQEGRERISSRDSARGARKYYIIGGRSEYLGVRIVGEHNSHIAVQTYTSNSPEVMPVLRLSVVYLGVLTTAFTNWLQTIGQQSIPATTASAIYALDPILSSNESKIVEGPGPCDGLGHNCLNPLKRDGPRTCNAYRFTYKTLVFLWETMAPVKLTNAIWSRFFNF